MIENSIQLGQALRAEAAQLRVVLSHDTHYDAANWVLSWWNGRVLHRVDFQPMESGEVLITYYTDHFKVLPRFLRWAHRAIPFFPYLARIEWSTVSTERFPFKEPHLRALLGKLVPVSHGFAA